MGLLVKHKYRVQIHWLNHAIEFKDVLAINEFQAKDKVINGSDKGLYDAERSKAVVIKHNVAVQRVSDLNSQ